MIWSGWSKQAAEEMFVNKNIPAIKLKESNMSDFWKKNEPNGGKGENCVLLETDNGFADVACDRKHCGICDLPISTVFHMKGLCQTSKFDFEYSWTGEYSDEQANRYAFVGVRNEGFLFWDDSQKYWKLENIKDKTIFAILNKTENSLVTEAAQYSYPFGTNFWYIFNDNCKNQGVEVAPNTYKTKMSFNACKEDMFNCHDGTWYVNLIYSNHYNLQFVFFLQYF